MVADVFNLFNRQAINQFDERYNLTSDGDAARASRRDSATATAACIATARTRTDPVGQIPNPRATATNPDYLEEGLAFTGAAQHPPRRPLHVLAALA